MGPRHESERTETGTDVTLCMLNCIILPRLCTPVRWTDMEVILCRHASQLSRIFWEAFEQFLSTIAHLQTGDISHSFITSHAARYEEGMRDTGEALKNCIGCIDEMVIGLARLGTCDAQNVLYNGNNRKKSFKYHVVTTTGGLLPHAYRTMEGIRHDWTLYWRSGLNESLQHVMVIDERHKLYMVIQVIT